ncbi:hypothetical protein A1O7_06242 [Cladophialophora yegresii CBS 114405]|uniref:Zn(2)-C6 fungal-type domain-containing protein n=1 Tax=Cladophialophora yegresii CBS 114405 TaxID=1182544 RepID=W9VSU3_9EURO|nr:uncharacterized protein A1O7_06242 [Cladophialophora yegresii CBS 114405]EXJ58812.1 hypothetical protein A1O7_06242 [Cladophialophora yegresii CBS 114405]
MFFIVPERRASDTPPGPHSESPSGSPCPAKRQRLSPEADDMSGYYPKRTPKACDRCRLKKARCQWSEGKICNKCKRDGVICTTNRESKREPKTPNAAYVQLVESQRDCLLRAISKLLEDGLVKDKTAMAKTLQDFGIRADALRKASQHRPEDEDGTDLRDADLYRNAAEIQALLDEYESSTGIVVQPGSFVGLSYNDGFTPESAFPESSANILPSLDTTFLPSIDAVDWLVPNGAGDSWLPPAVDLVAGR